MSMGLITQLERHAALRYCTTQFDPCLTLTILTIIIVMISIGRTCLSFLLLSHYALTVTWLSEDFRNSSIKFDSPITLTETTET